MVRSAQWHPGDVGFWSWFDHVEFEHRSDLYPFLLAWMEGFISGYPYILVDTFDDPWVEQHLPAYPGPTAIVQDNRHRFALVGGTSPQLLRDHQAEYGLSWIGGLRVYVFRTLTEVEEQLQSWHGQPVEALTSFVHTPLMTLTTGGDAEGLHVRPGERTMDELLEQGQQVARRLGAEWGPL